MENEKFWRLGCVTTCCHVVPLDAEANVDMTRSTCVPIVQSDVRGMQWRKPHWNASFRCEIAQAAEFLVHPSLTSMEPSAQFPHCLLDFLSGEAKLLSLSARFLVVTPTTIRHLAPYESLRTVRIPGIIIRTPVSTESHGCGSLK